ncbi:hypothetical protein PFICI_08634 [Pestalotiopsis fici W106-1]|uniref:Clr5 domain-containing protein n=1 Tax=Pestalotiopsis fici (strain W106-1 / CGMCC3.15140) TaxID=1229662 RepID=W3X0V8_PESFW|nr:uncharacterized protein PFICI_08634 [Pestalotiopsis fici W106-1]ETS78781.1 hypothetical protein PFICI_08634 [Pestalotiopsis fici W106-1]
MASGCIWQQHASLFRRLYLEENKTLKEVQSEVEDNHGFPSNSLSTYETKLRDLLGLRKNLNPEGWVAIDQHIRSVRSTNWEVYFNGRKMLKRKVMKEIARYTKHRSYPANLPMPPGVEIKWLDVSSQSAALSARGLPRRMVPQQLSRLTLDVPRNEDLDMIDFDSTALSRSPSDVLQETQLLRFNTPAIINPTVDIAVAANKVISAHFSAAILDPRLADLWHPILEDGPFNSLSRTLHRFFPGKTAFPHSNSILPVSRNNPTQNVDTWTLSSSSLEANQHEVSGRSHAVEDVENIQAQPSSGTISARLDPLRILALLIYYLSNNFAGLDQTRDTLLFLMEQVPHNLVGEFLQAESFAIETSWMTLAEWSFDLNKKHFFEKVMQVSLRCPEWVELHGARCLIFAAYFGCTKIARKIISCGVSPNEMSRFVVSLDDNNSSPNFSSLAVNEGYLHMGLDRERTREWKREYTVKTFPLMEAAARGNLEVLETLKNAKADCQLRSFGLTAAGYALIAHENGVMDDDVLSSVLSLLFDMGESLDAPMWQNDKAFRSGYGSKLEALWSEETLLDAIYLKRDSEVLFQEMQKRSRVPYGVMTVSGILRSAADGCNALRDYMATICYPNGHPRKRIEEVALVRSLTIPQAFESMMGNGFSLEFKALQNAVNIGGACYHLSLPGPTRSDILEILFRNRAELSASVVQQILDRLMEDQTNDSMSTTLICEHIQDMLPILRPDQIRRFGTILLEQFCKEGKITKVQLCLEAGVDPRAVDLLKIKSGGCDDTRIHQLLYEHGCRLILPLQPLEHKQLPRRYTTTELQWLITHGLNEVLNGMSIHDIITQFVSDRVSMYKVRKFAQWLSDRGYPLYTQPPSTALFQQCELRESSPSLALLIYLESNEDHISRLLDQGLDINPQRCRKRNEVDHPKLSRWYDEPPLEAAVRNCDISMVQLLLRRGADIHCQIDDSETVLDVAVDLYLDAYDSQLARWKELVTILLENGAKPGHNPSDALSRAIESPEPDLQLIRMLLENGADPKANYARSLRGAATSDSPNLQLIQMLLENGADPKENSSTLLPYAATSDRPNLQLIQMLLENGAKVNDDYYEKPLLRTVLLSTEINLELKMAIFALLLAHGAKYNSSEELVYACISGDIELVRFHLNKGANPNVWFNKDHVTWDDDMLQNPLGPSAQKGNVPIALVLLAAGATLSGRDRSLSLAAENGRLDMVALLLPHEKRLKEVKKALGCALKGRYYSIIRLLRQRLAAANQED